jgi:hypothetical protein
VHFEVVGDVEGIEQVAAGPSVRARVRLTKAYGGARWRKLKGTARLRLRDGTVRMAELHWYEAHGVGRKETKIKRFLD